MQFELEVWRKTYDEIKNLGGKYKDSLPCFVWNMDTMKWDKSPPLKPLFPEESKELQDKINFLIAKVQSYMDSCEALSPRRLYVNKY